MSTFPLPDSTDFHFIPSLVYVWVSYGDIFSICLRNKFNLCQPGTEMSFEFYVLRFIVVRQRMSLPCIWLLQEKRLLQKRWNKTKTYVFPPFFSIIMGSCHNFHAFSLICFLVVSSCRIFLYSRFPFIHFGVEFTRCPTLRVSVAVWFVASHTYTRKDVLVPIVILFIGSMSMSFILPCRQIPFHLNAYANAKKDLHYNTNGRLYR